MNFIWTDVCMRNDMCFNIGGEIVISIKKMNESLTISEHNDCVIYLLNMHNIYERIAQMNRAVTRSHKSTGEYL